MSSWHYAHESIFYASPIITALGSVVAIDQTGLVMSLSLGKWIFGVLTSFVTS
jgi:hypothetical protein